MAISDLIARSAARPPHLEMLEKRVLMAIPAAPTNLTAIPRSDLRVDLSWSDNSGGEEGFRIERSANGVSFVVVGTVGANILSFSDTAGLAPYTKYAYRVCAFAGSEVSEFAPALGTQTLPTCTQYRWVDDDSAAATPDGSFGKPYKTIAKALTGAGAGVGVVVRGGTYSEAVSLPSGTAGSPFILMGLPGERAIISGFTAVSGWQPWTGGPAGAYQVTLNWKPNTLYVDNTRLVQARTPNDGWWKAQSIGYAGGIVTITDSNLIGGPDLTGATMEGYVSNANAFRADTIISHDRDAGTITVDSSDLQYSTRYIIRNDRDLVDSPGEWAVESTGTGQYTVYFHPTSQDDLNRTRTRKLTNLVYSGSTAHDMIVQNLEITGADGPEEAVADTVGVSGHGVRVVGSSSDPVENFTLRDCIVHDNAGYGVYVRYVTNHLITRNVVMTNYTGMVIASATNMVVEQNEVGLNMADGVVVAGDISGRQPGATGFTPTDNVVLRSNYIHHHLSYAHPDGIQVYRWVTNLHIVDNLIVASGQGLMTQESSESELKGNIIYSATARTVNHGYTSSYNWAMDNNTVAGSGWQLTWFAGTGCSSDGNVLVGQFHEEPTATGDYNLFYASAPSTNILFTTSPTKFYSSLSSFQTATGREMNSAQANPEFVNAPLIHMVVDDNLLASCTTTTLCLRSSPGLSASVGDHIEINVDGVVRTVTAVDTVNRTISFTPALPNKPVAGVVIDNWKASTDFNLDFRLRSSSAGANLAAGGGPVGSTINATAYKAGDFNGDGVRDLPVMPRDVVAGLPDPNSVTMGRPLAVESRISDGTAQRSMVKSVTYIFNRPVILGPGAFSLVRRGDGAAISPVIENPSGDRQSYTLRFAGAGVVGGSLADGVYDLKLNSLAVTDLAGVPRLVRDVSVRFHRLFGDSDGDRDVDSVDLSAFRRAMNRPANYGTYWYFDFDGNGAINAGDYAAFKSRLTRNVLR